MSKACRKCGNPLPNYAFFDGATHHIGARKFCLECSPWKGHNTKKIIYDLVPGTSVCPKCKTPKDVSLFYRKGSGHQTYCKQCYNKIQHERKRSRKIKAVKLMGGKCQKCGYDRCLDALDFHHLDKSKKESVFSAISMRSWAKVLEELKKCVLLCTRCHREEHSESYTGEIIHWADVRLEIGATGKCPVCGVEVYGTTLCSEACRAAFRTLKRPTKLELANDMKMMNRHEAAKKYNVSEATVRKWIKGFCLDDGMAPPGGVEPPLAV